jgi:Tfp pilus assembly protein PilE
MTIRRRESGFTAVELLVTLFVAAAFLIAAYQLFNLVVKDGGSTRSESRAANVAYDYLRQYAASSTTIPCTASSNIGVPLTIDGLTNVTLNIDVTCLPDATTSLSKVTATIFYNNPQQSVKYATFTSSTSTSTTTDITNGLVAWWKLNGDTNNAVGSPNGVNTNATSTTGQSGVADTAYSFNGTTSSINTASTFGLGTTNASISAWVNSPTASNKGLFVNVGSTAGFGVGIGNTTTATVGTFIVMTFNAGGRSIPTTTALGTGWHHIAMVIDASGTPTAYRDGVAVGSYAGTNATTPSSSVTTIGAQSGSSTNNFNGSIDDVRLYNRALSASEVLSLYSGQAK